MRTKVVVNNLGAATAETDLPDLLSDLFSSPLMARLPRSLCQWIYPTAGCVIMTTREGAGRAVQGLNGQSIGACILAVQLSIDY